jgi:cytochrome c oxidase assembly protein subunit 15
MTPDGPRRAVGLWFLGCAALVFAMVVVGGVTRLTHAGLSITQWKPLTGVLPPLGETAWLDEFARYQASPEYRLVNLGMTLPQFQRIYLIEYGHRLLGRLAGAAFLLPMLWFLGRRSLTGPRVTFALALLALGGFQGGLGWFMVKSGLVDVPRVSPYRLAAHLGVALVLLVLLVWAGTRELAPGPRRPGPLWGLCLGVLGLTALWGALVAGLRAGHLFPTFPRMNGAWIPAGVGALSPPWLDAFENAATVHAIHRLLALLSSALLLAGWWRWRGRLGGGRAALLLWAALPSLLALQGALGAATVLRHVPLGLAAAHQANAALLLAALAALGTRLVPAPPANSHR